jgi:ADP-ribose pyrophosphatase
MLPPYTFFSFFVCYNKGKDVKTMEKELEREIIMNGKIMTVTKEKVLLEDGNTSYREVVYHHGGVSVLAMKDDKIVLVKQFRYPNRTNTIELPAGKLEKDENPRDCALRELEEETNYRAKDMRFLLKFLPSPAYTSEWIHIYEAIDFQKVDDALTGDDDEFIDVIELPIEEAYNKVLNGEIVDGKTVIAIMYAYQKKCKGV